MLEWINTPLGQGDRNNPGQSYAGAVLTCGDCGSHNFNVFRLNHHPDNYVHLQCVGCLGVFCQGHQCDHEVRLDT
jgi:hypothetical protein